MAEHCPKCNYKLRIKDWRPECPECGANILYYGNEDRLREEADRVELSHAKIQPRFDRLKFSMIGHPLSIVRLVLAILPLLFVLIPSGSVILNIPFGEQTHSVGFISVVMHIVDKGLDFDLLFAFIKSPLLGKAALGWLLGVLGLVLKLVSGLVGLICLTMSAAKKGFKRNIIFSCLGIVFSTVSFAGYIIYAGGLRAAFPGNVTVTVIPVAFILVILTYIAQIAVNVVFKKKKIEVKYTDVSELFLPYNERPSVIAKKEAAEKASQAAAE